nr:Ig-like domain-containing protein [Brevibacterium yomogidense]
MIQLEETHLAGRGRPRPIHVRKRKDVYHDGIPEGSGRRRFRAGRAARVPFSVGVSIVDPTLRSIRAGRILPSRVPAAWSWWASLIAALAVVASPGLTPGVVASAAQLDTVVTDLRTVGRAAPGEAFRIDVDWVLPDEARPDDSFGIELPDALQPLEESFDVTDPRGDVIAHAAAVDEGVDFTLTEYVDSHADVFGVIHFGVEVVDGAQPGGFVDIGWGGGRATTVEVMPRSDEGWINSRHKGQTYGEYYPDTGVVEWIIMGPLGHDSVTFDDSAEGGQVFLCAQMRVEIWNLDVGGHWDSSLLAQNHDVTCTEGHVQGTIRDVPRGKIGAIIIPTLVPEDATEVENTAAITVDGRTDEPTAESIVTSSGGQGGGEAVGEGAGAGGDGGGEGAQDGLAAWDGEPQAADAWHQQLWKSAPAVIALGLLVLLAALIAAVMVRRRK